MIVHVVQSGNGGVERDTVNVAKCLQLVNLGDRFMGIHCIILATFVKA